MLNILKGYKIIIKEHIAYKSQILNLAKLNLLKTYRGTAIGTVWAILKPCIEILIYWFVFKIGLKSGKDVNGYSFFLWLIVGVVPWFYMSDMITGGTEIVRKYRNVISKVKFPVSVIPTFFSLSKFLNNAILFFIVILIFMINGFLPDIYYLQIPFYMILTFVFFTTWSLLGSMICCISKDFSNLVKSLLKAVFWLSGIIWNPAGIEITWLRQLLMLNPVTYLITGFRNCFINKVWFWEEPKSLMFFIMLTAVMTILATQSYKKLRKQLPDIL